MKQGLGALVVLFLREQGRRDGDTSGKSAFLAVDRVKQSSLAVAQISYQIARVKEGDTEAAASRKA